MSPVPQDWASRPIIGGYPEGYNADWSAPPPDPGFDFQVPSFDMPSFNYPAYDFSSLGAIEHASPHYSFEPRTLQDTGLSIPIAIGQEKLNGNIVNMFTTNEGDKHFLNVLIALCEGESEEITTVLINGNPLSNYTGITTYERMGTNDQAIIPNFSDLHSLNSVDLTIAAGESKTYTTNLTNVEAFEANLKCLGLYQIDPNNFATLNYSISVKIGYRIYGSGDPWTETTITKTRDQKTEVRFKERVESLAANRYDIQITNLNSADTEHTESTFVFVSVDEILTDDLIYPNITLWGCKLLATEQLSGGVPNFEFIGKWLKVSIPKIMYSGAEVPWADYYYDSDTSEWKRFIDDAVCTWDSVTWVTRFSRNPIWNIKNIQLKERYGLGERIAAAHINDSNYLEMAKHCENKVPDGNGGFEKRFELDVVIDSPTRATDLLNQLAVVFNGFTFYSGGKINYKIDKAEDPVRLLGMNDIINNSFNQSWRSRRELPNVIEVTYRDEDKNYVDETIQFGEPAVGEAARRQEVRIFTTKMSQALRAGRHIKNVTTNINRLVSLRAAINCTLINTGDVVYVSHDTPQWGFSGKAEANSTVDLVKLDRSVTVEAGKTYQIMVQFSDDTIEEKTVSDGPGTYTEVGVTSSFSQAPAEYDSYAFHDSSIPLPQFRITNYKREMRNQISLSSMEYNSAVYDDTAVTIPVSSYSALINTIPDVTNLVLDERVQRLKDGTAEDVIDVFFQIPVQTTYHLKKYDHVKIFLKEGASGEWVFRGLCYTEKYSIMGNIDDGKTYYVSVVTVDANGIENNVDDSPTDSISVVGKEAKPSDVQNYEVFQEGALVRHVWDPLDYDVDGDVDEYIIKEGSEWNTGTVIAELVDVTEFTAPVGKIGSVTYMVKARDRSTNESANPAVDEITLTQPPEKNFTNTLNLWSASQFAEYIVSGVGPIQRNYYDSTYVRTVLALNNATWASTLSGYSTWDEAALDGLFKKLSEGPFVASGKYETVTPFDLETIFEFKIITDADYYNVTGGSLEIQISHSEDDITYTTFAEISASTTYRARYINIRVILSTSNTAYNIYLYNLNIFINAPVVLSDYGRDVAVPIAGIRINFRGDYTVAPRFVANVINGIKGFLEIDDKTISGANVKMYDTDGTTPLDTAEIDWDAKGS